MQHCARLDKNITTMAHLVLFSLSPATAFMFGRHYDCVEERRGSESDNTNKLDDGGGSGGNGKNMCSLMG